MNLFLTLILLLIAFAGLSYAYTFFNTAELEDEDLVLSIHFLQNVTSVRDTLITLDFVDEKVTFESTLFVKGDGMLLSTHDKNFQNYDSACGRHFTIVSNNTDIMYRTWNDNLRFSFDGLGEFDHIKMKKICTFEEPLVPNGDFGVHVYGNKTSVGMPLDKVSFTMLFDSKKFECRDKCISSNQFLVTDSDEEHDVKTLTLEGNNVNSRYMDFELRTTDAYSKQIADYFFIAIQIMTGVAATILVFTISRNQQNQRKEERKKKLEISKDMIVKNLVGQTSLLDSYHKKPKLAENISNGKDMDMWDFEDRGIQGNNTELKSITLMTSDVLDSELLEDLHEFSSKIDFMYNFENFMADSSNVIIQLIQLQNIFKAHFPEKYSEFEEKLCKENKELLKQYKK